MRDIMRALGIAVAAEYKKRYPETIPEYLTRIEEAFACFMERKMLHHFDHYECMFVMILHGKPIFQNNNEPCTQNWINVEEMYYALQERQGDTDATVETVPND